MKPRIVHDKYVYNAEHKVHAKFMHYSFFQCMDKYEHKNESGPFISSVSFPKSGQLFLFQSALISAVCTEFQQTYKVT